MKYAAAAATTITIIVVAIAAASTLNTRGEKVYNVDEATNLSDLNQSIKVKGLLQKGPLMCTQRACIGENKCCKTCSAPIQIQGKQKITLKGEELGCSGTNCGVNCTPEPGKKYLVEGVLNKQYGEYSIQVENFERLNISEE